MIDIDTSEGVVVARLTGDIDMSNTAAIEDAIGQTVDSEQPGFVMEMSEVTYLDSAGVRLLYVLDERANGRQQQLVVVVPAASPICRTLEAAGALGSFNLVGTIDDAVEVLLGKKLAGT